MQGLRRAFLERIFPVPLFVVSPLALLLVAMDR